jgi:hypothetical protein
MTPDLLIAPRQPEHGPGPPRDLAEYVLKVLLRFLVPAGLEELDTKVILARNRSICTLFELAANPANIPQDGEQYSSQ